MQSMHRQFGRFMKRSADDSQVSVLLKDFENADQLLGKIIESSKAWRDAWSSILRNQLSLVHEFEGIYQPIIGSSDDPPHEPAPTPEATMTRTVRLKEEYEQLQNDLREELNMVDDRMIKPAMQAKDFLQPLKKVIKKRDDKKLDFERYQSRVDASRKKTKRSDRDNAILAKAEIDLSKAKEDYTAADDHLRSHLPSLLSATFSILPLLLNAQIEIQHTLLALCYTTLHNYCEEQQLPSPPPPMDVVMETWEHQFQPAQQDVENIGCLAHRKGGRQPRTSDDSKNGSAPNGVGHGHRRVSNQSIGRKPSASPIRNDPRVPSPGSTTTESRPRPSNGSAYPPTPSPSTLAPTPHHHSRSGSGSNSASYFSPEVSSAYHQHPTSPPNLSSPRPDTQRPTSSSRSPSASAPSGVGNMAAAAAAAAKKKPPPPPPRTGSASQVHFVTALYDFGGEGEGDLAFQEGDRIRVLKKTDSTDDWWEGELRGMRGSFPANYCN